MFQIRAFKMTTRTELMEIISNGENSGVEFKRDSLRPQDLAKELVAFSNLEGGMVILGVEDSGEISGITREDLEEWVMNVCRQKIRPELNPYFEVIHQIEGQKAVAVVRVTRGYSVHTLWHNNSSKYLVRVGSQSREASPEELARLFQQRRALRAELQAISGSSISNLDRRRLKNYFVGIRNQDVPDDGDDNSWQTLLENTEFLTEEAVTVGGMLLFGKTPNRFLPQAGIDAVAYCGTEKDYDALERTALRGPMTPLLGESDEIVENGLVEQALNFVQRNTRMTVSLKGGRRMERPTYPVEVIREAVVNALIHRDYLLSGTDIELAIYRDRFEIISAGRLPNGITPERMRAGTRSTRNQLLKDVMRDYRYLEHMGMGIPRKIVQGMIAHNGKDPELNEMGERFLVRLLA